jgi:hypothetical protein
MTISMTESFDFEKPAPRTPISMDRTSEVSRRAALTGRILSGLAVAFLAMDATMKLFSVPAAVQGTAQLGYPTSVLFGIGVVQAICLALYLIPRTAVLGAVLWTGYLGGAIATHVRVGSPLFTHVLFPIYVAAFLWGGLWLRDRRVRAMLSK